MLPHENTQEKPATQNLFQDTTSWNKQWGNTSFSTNDQLHGNSKTYYNSTATEVENLHPCRPGIYITIIDKVILTVGVIANVLVLSVVLRKSFLRNALGVHLICLAVFDSLTLITQSILSEYNPTDMIGCKMLGYINTMVEIQSSWTLVTIAVERVLAVFVPHRARITSNVKRAAYVQLSVSISVALVCIWIIFFSTLQQNGPVITCILKDVFPDHKYKVFQDLFYMMLYSFLPCALLIVFNAMIIVGLRQHFLFRQNSSSSRDDNDESRRLNIMLIFTCILYAVTTLPISLYLTIIHIPMGSHEIVHYREDYVKMSLFLLQKFNHAGNFFVYYISGSQFRKEFKKTWTCTKDYRPQSILLMKMN